ncbi:MAG: alpha/beta hydrolase [Gemmatimonadota bacterium]
MGKSRVWLATGLGILAGLVAEALLGRTASRDPSAAARSAATPERGTSDACRLDAAGHDVRFVTVEPGVELEVLDWGGTGETVVLLAGLGDNAHVFDEFAWQLNDRFHVIAITRRGFGRSSQPAAGYDVDTRARDDIAVLDRLNIRTAVFIGHSVAGTELNRLGAAYPERVKKLVYLDGLDLGSGGWTALPQPPSAPEWTAADLQSVQRAAAADARDAGFRKPLAALCNSFRMDSAGKVTGAITPDEISSKITEGLQPAEYDRIRAPALGIFNRISPQYRLPYYWRLDAAAQADFARKIEPLAQWIDGAIQRFRSGVRHSRVVELHDANHYVFVVDEALVVRGVRRFLLEE